MAQLPETIRRVITGVFEVLYKELAPRQETPEDLEVFEDTVESFPDRPNTSTPDIPENTILQDTSIDSLVTLSEAHITPPPQNPVTQAQAIPNSHKMDNRNNNPVTHKPSIRPHTQYIPTQSVSNSVDPSGMKLKVKDIEKLLLHQLSGFGAYRRLESFLEDVELCSNLDKDRIRIVFSRVEGPIVDLLKEEMIKYGNNVTWNEFKNIMRLNFIGNIGCKEALKEVEAETYSLDEAPRAFAHKVACKLAALRQRFPSENLPERGQFTKLQLFRGLNSELKRLMESHMDASIEFETFLQTLEYHYHISIDRGEVIKRRVQAISTPTPNQSSGVDRSKGQAKDGKVEALQREIQALKARLGDRPGGGRRPKYCAFCLTQGHNLAECPRNPPRGVCFDCLQPNLRRGHVNCSGRRSDQ